jgi:hypothetical protein
VETAEDEEFIERLKRGDFDAPDLLE